MGAEMSCACKEDDGFTRQLSPIEGKIQQVHEECPIGVPRAARQQSDSPAAEDTDAKAQASTIVNPTGVFQETPCPISAEERRSQLDRLAHHDGLIVASDHSLEVAQDLLLKYGVHQDQLVTLEQCSAGLQALSSRLVALLKSDGSRVTAVVLGGEVLSTEVSGQPLAAYLWQTKHIVPIFSGQNDYAPEKNGVELIAGDFDLEAKLQQAVANGIYTLKLRSKILKPNESGIVALVEQQIEMAKDILAHELVPFLQIEVSHTAPEKQKCEELLLEHLMLRLEQLGEGQAIIVATLPSKPNFLMPLVDHPNVIRLFASSGGHDREVACQYLAKNQGMRACFGRPFIEKINVDLTDDEFKAAIDESCRTILQASRVVTMEEEMMAKITSKDGFFCAIDSYGNSIIRALKAYGVAQSDDPQVTKDAIHAMRIRICTNPRFNSYYLIAAAVCESRANKEICGLPTANYLWEVKKIVPFLTIEKELEEEKDGVQILKDVAIDQLAKRCKGGDFFGIKAKSVIKAANQVGIKAAVKAQLDLAKKIVTKGLVPLLAFQVLSSSADKDKSERMLMDTLTAGLNKLNADQKVVLELSLPNEANIYFPLVNHPNTLRLTGARGTATNTTLTKVCGVLEQNIGMTANFDLAFLEDLKINTTEEEFSASLNEGCKIIYRASTAVPVKEEQKIKISAQDGIFVAMDQTGAVSAKTLERYGISTEGFDTQEIINAAHDMRYRLITDPSFNSSRVVSVALSEATAERDIGGRKTPQYLWEEKSIVPFLKIDKGQAPLEDGVQLMKDMPNLSKILNKANSLGMFGTKEKSLIKSANPVGITKAVEQQFDIAKKVLARDLVPMMQIEVDIEATDKADCEQMVFNGVMDGLSALTVGDRVILVFNLPTTPNLYLPFNGHPNVIRVLAMSGGYDQAEACRRLAENPGMTALFSRALTEKNRVDQTDEQHTLALTESLNVVFKASQAIPWRQEQLTKLTCLNGFVVAFDQELNEMPAILESYGFESKTWITKAGGINEKEIQSLRFDLQERVMLNYKFNGARVIAANLTPDSMVRSLKGKPMAVYLWEVKKILPFLKIDVGLAPAKDGVQMMLDNPNMQDLIDRAVVAGILGTVSKSVIKNPNKEGIDAMVEQQLAVARKVLDRNLVPNIQLAIHPQAADKPGCERLLRQSLTSGLSKLKPSQRIMISFTMPSKANTYLPLMRHPNIIRILGMSAGADNRKEAVATLSSNSGMSPSFGRVFVQSLTVKQTDKAFTKQLEDNCQEIYAAVSVQVKEAPVADATVQGG